MSAGRADSSSSTATEGTKEAAVHIAANKAIRCSLLHLTGTSPLRTHHGAELAALGALAPIAGTEEERMLCATRHRRGTHGLIAAREALGGEVHRVRLGCLCEERGEARVELRWEERQLDAG